MKRTVPIVWLWRGAADPRPELRPDRPGSLEGAHEAGGTRVSRVLAVVVGEKGHHHRIESGGGAETVAENFGITGAPWTKGVKRGEVGGSVIIGGQRKKTEKVLMYLRRMYMPLKNYKDLEKEFLVNYWNQDKDILGVTHFGDLVPEVVWLDPEYEQMLQELIVIRIRYKLDKHQGRRPDARK